MSRMKPLFLDTSGLTVKEMEQWGKDLAEQQRAVNWMLGDVARYAKYGLKLGDNYTQVFPEWMSPGLIQRCEAVANAYPREEDRNILATWTQHMQVANKPNRIELVAAKVDRGLTSDESREADQEERADDNRPRWLLAVDVHLFVHKWYHSGSGVETAMKLSEWIQRTVTRLKEKGLTDVACCFDGPHNFRRTLTEGWEKPYKGDRGPKELELVQQLQLTRNLLDGFGFACVTLEGYESDDIMASFSVQFPGKVTLLSTDKDVRQCLSSKCNLLVSVEWTEDETSGDLLPEYDWITAQSHTKDGCAYNNILVQGIRPDQWAEFQTLAGDPVDSVGGAKGVGAAIAAALIKRFGSVERVIEEARHEEICPVCEFAWIKPKKREALIEFEAKLDVTRQLVTLRTDLPIPETTRV